MLEVIGSKNVHPLKGTRAMYLALTLLLSVFLQGCFTLPRVPPSVMGASGRVPDEVLYTQEDVNDIQFAPEGDRLLIAYGQGKERHFYQVSLDGETWRRLTEEGTYNTAPTYSPDGKALIFSRKTGKRKASLFKMNASGGEATRLTHEESFDWGAQYSPDGSAIVFVSTTFEFGCQIFIMNADGSGRRQLTDESLHNVDPVFLPDGESVLFARGGFYGHNSPIATMRWHDFDMFEVSLGEGTTTKVSAEAEGSAGPFLVSPDGRQVLHRYSRWSRSDSGSLSDVKTRYGILDGQYRQYSRDWKHVALVCSPTRKRPPDDREVRLTDVLTEEYRTVARIRDFLPPVRFEVYDLQLSPKLDKVLVGIHYKTGEVAGQNRLWILDVEGVESPYSIAVNPPHD